MSLYYSPDDEAPLTEDEAQLLFYPHQPSLNSPATHSNAPSASYQQQPATWGSSLYPELSSTSGHMPPQAFAPPSQYVSWPTTAYPQLQPMDFSSGQRAPSQGVVVPSTPFAPQALSNAPWPSLHPDDAEAPSDMSRSTSPNPSDLYNFGILLPDGRSWRCAYAGCTSQARFTRGCDLRKHYNRHTKSLFCRHEDCPQAHEGGFSSNKDRVSTSCTCHCHPSLALQACLAEPCLVRTVWTAFTS